MPRRGAGQNRQADRRRPVTVLPMEGRRGGKTCGHSAPLYPPQDLPQDETPRRRRLCGEGWGEAWGVYYGEREDGVRDMRVLRLILRDSAVSLGGGLLEGSRELGIG